MLVDVKGFSEQDEQSQELQLEARVAGSRTLQLGQSDSVLFPYLDSSRALWKLTTAAVVISKEQPTLLTVRVIVS